MNVDIKKITAETFEQGEAILKRQLSGGYEIRGVESKRKFWLFGAKTCDISYVEKQTNIVSMTDPVAKKALKGDSGDYVSKKEMLDYAESIEDINDKLGAFMTEVSLVLKKADQNSNDGLRQMEDALTKGGVDRGIVDLIIKDVVDVLPKRQKTLNKNTLVLALKETLMKKLNATDGYDLDTVRSIVLVGPTGVGKTTTVAKLASLLYSRKKDVGLITLDTYRMGAVQQLKEYSNIMSFDVEACSTVSQLEDSIIRYIDKDVVLVDTTGQNQKCISEDESLKQMVDLVNPDQLTLVLSATTKTEDLYDCIERFSCLTVNSIIMTKLDETNTLGSIINVAYKYPKIKLAYFTNGQEVPADIEGARPEKIIKALVNVD